MRWFGRFVNRWLEERTFVRNVRAGALLERFFIAAVAAVLVIRFYLLFAYPYLVEYVPVLGSVVVGPFHIAHMLWGGLLMLAGFVLLLTFLGRSVHGVAAVIGGIGFGTFVDELGKVITLDKDYLYQPIFSIIYLIFVGLFIWLRVIQRPRRLSEQAALVNALQYAQQTVLEDLGPEERRHALSLLDQSDPSHPMVAPLQQTMESMDMTALRRPSIFERLRITLRRTYAWLVRRWWFSYAVVGLFVVVSIGDLYQTVFQVVWSEYLVAIVVIALLGMLLLSGALFARHPSTRLVRTVGLLLIAVLLSAGIALHLEQRPDTFVYWIQLIAPTISSVLVLAGTLLIWRSRVSAYRMFVLAVLVSIFVTQVFAFHDAQVLAVIGLFLRVIILMVVRFMLDQEEVAAASSRSRG